MQDWQDACQCGLCQGVQVAAAGIGKREFLLTGWALALQRLWSCTGAGKQHWINESAEVFLCSFLFFLMEMLPFLGVENTHSCSPLLVQNWLWEPLVSVTGGFSWMAWWKGGLAEKSELAGHWNHPVDVWGGGGDGERCLSKEVLTPFWSSLAALGRSSC